MLYIISIVTTLPITEVEGHYRFLGKIQKSGVRNSMTDRLPNSRKSNFATEPSRVPICDLSGIGLWQRRRTMGSPQAPVQLQGALCHGRPAEVLLNVRSAIVAHLMAEHWVRQ